MTRGPTINFLGGAEIPDWGAITTHRAGAALLALFEAFFGPKWKGVTDDEGKVLRAVLQNYAAHGRAPTNVELTLALGLPAVEVTAELTRLASRDLVVLDFNGSVAGAYPFTDSPNEHRVETPRVTVGAMCAIDALGIGSMLGREAKISSACRHCGQPILIQVGQEGRLLERSEPADVVVWSGFGYGDDCAARSLCPQQAFFCDEAHLNASLDHACIGDAGIRINLNEALEVGRANLEHLRRQAGLPCGPGE